ncbi:MAG: hypothetical protein AB2L12_16200 [Smithellaceae bacterium]
MLNLFKKKIGLVASLVLVLLLVPVIVSYSAEKEMDKTKRPLRIAIIPFQAVLSKAEAGNTVVCPLCGLVYFGGKIVPGGEKVVEELFSEKLKEYKYIEIIPQEKVEGIYKRISTESLKMPLLEIIKKAGTELKADLIAVGYVFRYVERIGYDYSAEKAASVAFEINFVNPKDGSTIWRGAFDKTQKSLMEDVLQIASFYKGGGKWLTARELTRQGMEQAFKTFSGFEH